MVDVAVVGAGLIGSAAAKYLVREGLDTLLIGPGENNTHGIHGSHHDEARVTRYSGPDLIWSQLAAASIAEYASIEQDSGMKLHRPCGHLRCDLAPTHPDSSIHSVRDVLRRMPVETEELNAETARTRFPYLHFQDDGILNLEPAPAGLINPRSLVRAQQEVGRKYGLAVRQDVVHSVQQENGHFTLITPEETIKARQVLVAAGAYTSLMSLLPRAIPFSVRPETVLLVDVSQDLLGELSTMPGIIWNFDHHQELPYAYILPPVQYADGRWYIKIGADHDKDVPAESASDFDSYMRGEGSERTARMLHELLLQLIPALKGASWRSKPCMLTYTEHGYPYIDEVSEGWFVAAGGCGKSAKSSDHIGYLAARLVTGKSWPNVFKRSTFAVS